MKIRRRAGVGAQPSYVVFRTRSANLCRQRRFGRPFKAPRLAVAIVRTFVGSIARTSTASASRESEVRFDARRAAKCNLLNSGGMLGRLRALRIHWR